MPLHAPGIIVEALRPVYVTIRRKGEHWPYSVKDEKGRLLCSIYDWEEAKAYADSRGFLIDGDRR